LVFFFQAADGIRDFHVTGVQTCALPICSSRWCACDRSALPSSAGAAARPPHRRRALPPPPAGRLRADVRRRPRRARIRKTSPPPPPPPRGQPPGAGVPVLAISAFSRAPHASTPLSNRDKYILGDKGYMPGLTVPSGRAGSVRELF